MNTLLSQKKKKHKDKSNNNINNSIHLKMEKQLRKMQNNNRVSSSDSDDHFGIEDLDQENQISMQKGYLEDQREKLLNRRYARRQ